MTDYSNMSDFEINGRVARVTQKIGDATQARGRTFIHEHEDVGEFKNICIGWIEYDPCNNPSDAWPIILANKISTITDETTTLWSSSVIQDFCDNGAFKYSNCNENPLRAAMIVFLMMKETEQCSS